MDSDAKTLLEQGIRALRDQKDKAAARQHLADSLRLDPNNDVAWLWLSQTIDNPAKKLDCINRALKLNPQNKQALELQQRALQSPAPAPRQAAAPSVDEPTETTVNPAGIALGDLLAASQVRIVASIVKVVLSVFLVGVAIISMLVYRALEGGRLLSPFMIVFLLLLLVGVVWLLFTTVRDYGKRIEVYEKGISRIVAGERKSWPWKDFSAFKINERTYVYRTMGFPVYRYTTYECILMIDDKTVLKINNDFQHHRETGQAIADILVRQFFHRDLVAYRRGETLRYGGILVDRKGIRNRGQSLRWQDIREWTVHEGTLFIERRMPSGTVKFRLFNVPNALVLMMIIGNLTSDAD